MNESVSEQRKTLYTWLLGIGIVLFMLSGYLWWRDVYNSPHRVFWSMISNNLATTGVTRRMIHEQQGSSSDQKVQLVFGPQTLIRSETTLKQPGEAGENIVVSESIGTETADYNRYVKVETQAKDASGQEPDFSQVLNVWGKSEQTEGADPGSGPQLLSESVLGVALFGNLDENQREELVKFVQDKKVYEPKYGGIKREKQDGRNVYVYSVDVHPQAYLEMLKKYVEMTGLKGADDLDPESYAGSPPFVLKIAIDPLTRQLKRVDYPEGTNRYEEYTAYGAVPAVSIPSETIPVSELQQRIQQTQQ